MRRKLAALLVAARLDLGFGQRVEVHLGQHIVGGKISLQQTIRRVPEKAPWWQPR